MLANIVELHRTLSRSAILFGFDRKLHATRRTACELIVYLEYVVKKNYPLAATACRQYYLLLSGTRKQGASGLLFPVFVLVVRAYVSYCFGSIVKFCHLSKFP